VWTHCFQSDLAGGKNGPLDAYRHTLASATVAYTLSPAAVDWVTAAFEDQATPAGSMDAHNNAIGAALGARAAHFGDIAAMVSQQVQNGAENTAIATQTTWLAKRQWDERWLGKAF
jgi:hypothetical protein